MEINRMNLGNYVKEKAHKKIHLKEQEQPQQ